jgi:hypothetical protein
MATAKKVATKKQRSSGGSAKKATGKGASTPKAAKRPATKKK